MNIRVPKRIAVQIKTAKDLNDYYAYCETDGQERTYTFPESEQDRIVSLLDDLNYTGGVYDRDNIERILGLRTAEYVAEYTTLIDGATWGTQDYEFEAENDKQAIKIAKQYEKNFIERRNGSTKELLLDYVYDEQGELIYAFD